MTNFCKIMRYYFKCTSIYQEMIPVPQAPISKTLSLCIELITEPGTILIN